jgi:hypothetical protein
MPTCMVINGQPAQSANKLTRPAHPGQSWPVSRTAVFVQFNVTVDHCARMRGFEAVSGSRRGSDETLARPARPPGPRGFPVPHTYSQSRAREIEQERGRCCRSRTLGGVAGCPWAGWCRGGESTRGGGATASGYSHRLGWIRSDCWRPSAQVSSSLIHHRRLHLVLSCRPRRRRLSYLSFSKTSLVGCVSELLPSPPPSSCLSGLFAAEALSRPSRLDDFTDPPHTAIMSHSAHGGDAVECKVSVRCLPSSFPHTSTPTDLMRLADALELVHDRCL